ncbi:CPBP family intramembrane glutamic endopeptidase [Fusobacterium polymorphum]|uniref:CPBP family intramembrane glutamic endopeptidase n=1 Tax=Fusobacterium nucleatum subsp. polymorphum TaxID=76857 RepID=UPI00300A9E6F
MGIIILYIVAKSMSFNCENIGFTRKKAIFYLGQGLLFGIFIYLISYGIEILINISHGQFKSFEFYVSTYSVEGNIGKQTAIIFFVICILGNIINVIMEEGIFRGLFQKLFEQKYNFLPSAILSSLLFGFWHIIAPLRSYYDGTISFEEMFINIIILVVTSTLVGLKFSMMTKLTGNLYMSMGDHFVNNTIINILHIVSKDGSIDKLLVMRISIAQTLSFLIVLIYFKLSKNECS